MKRVLITGAGGLIGGRLSEYLAAAGFLVRSGTRNVYAAPAGSSGPEVVFTDWSDDAALRQICRGVDVVVNAMGMNAAHCQADPVAALTVNGVYTAKLLRAAVAAGVQRFVHLSTAHVYGSPLEGTISEETCPSNLHPYATSHVAGEQAVMWGDRTGEIEGVVLRLSNAYGRPIHPAANCWTLLVNDLCRQAVEKRALSLRSGGNQERDFIPLASVCALIGSLCGTAAVSSVKSAPGVPSLFNVGRGISMSVAAMASFVQSRCEAVLGYSVELLKPRSSSPDAGPALRYISTNLEPSVLRVEQHISPEVDELLLFCRDHFSSIPTT